MYFKKAAQARKAGEAVQARLNDKFREGWELRVWENLGWHFDCRLGTMTVSMNEIDGSRQYHCMISSDYKYTGTGNADWTEDKRYSSPEEAVKHALETAWGVTAQKARILAENYRLIGISKQALQV
jgi:hypothetical protein